MKNKKKTALKIIAAAAAVYIAICFIIAPVYDRIYVDSFLKAHYSGFETLDTREYNGSWSLMGGNDSDRHYLEYKLYDKENGIEFVQGFTRYRLLPFYTADKPDMERYENYLWRKKYMSELTDSISIEITEPLGGFVIENPYDSREGSGFGVHIFLPRVTAEEAEKTALAMREKVNGILKENSGTYVSYSIFYCQDDELFSLFAKGKDTDFENRGYWGQGYFTDIAEQMTGCAFERIASDSNGFDAEAYEDIPHDGGKYVMWLDGEPNSDRHEHFYLFEAK